MQDRGSPRSAKTTPSKSIRPSTSLRRAAPGRSRSSGSASRTVLIFSIAADAACTWPYSSESSCSGWKTSASSPTAAISVPIVSEPCSKSSAPTPRTATVATTPSSSMVGKKTDESFWACRVAPAVRGVERVELGLEVPLAVEGLDDRHAGQDSAIWAVTAAMRVRTSAKAACDARWNQRVTRFRAAGRPARRAEAPVQDEQPDHRHDERQDVADERGEALRSTSESASTSLVRRAMIQPARCSEK